MKNMRDLQIVKRFNDTSSFEEPEVMQVEHISSSSDSSDTDSSSEKPKNPDQFRNKGPAVPAFKTAVPGHIPYRTSLINTGIVHKEIYDVLPTIYEFSKSGSRDEKWPKRTNIHCWWDAHSFNTVPIPAPCDYNRTLRKFRVNGCFCSFNCALAYVSQTSSANGSLLNYFYKKWTGKKCYLKAAPPRQALAIFGGPLTIQQFRENFNSETKINLIVPPLIPRIQKIEFSYVKPLVGNSTPRNTIDNNLEDVSQLIPQTKLRRSKPLQTGKSSISTQFLNK